MNIGILDCTLRDGGYVNNWNFNNKDIKRTIKKLVDANIEIIECGFLDFEKGKKENSTRFNSYKILEDIVSDIILNENQLLVAMIEYRKYDLSSLPNITKDSKVTGIRFSFRKSDYKIAMKEVEILKGKGYKIFIQPITTESYSDEELDDIIKIVNKIKPFSFYIVDTAGSMYNDNFEILKNKIEKVLSVDIKLGFHSHNNLQLSYAIAINFIHSIKNRDIIIDSSVYGMGRGAGNLNTELLADFLNKKYSKKYEIENILELIDSYYYALYKSNHWGYSLAHFLSASYSVHPNYASYLLDTKRLSINEIKSILAQIPNKNVYEYNKNLIEKLYFIHNSSKEKIVKEPKLQTNKKILLLGSGQKIKEKIKEIQEKRDEYLIISLNHVPDFTTSDFYFFNSQKRYDEFSENIEKYNIISSSNLEVTTNYTLDYKELCNINNEFQNDISVIMMINYLLKKGIDAVSLAGIDGFSINAENYTYEEVDKLVDENSINELNSSIKKAIETLSKHIKIEFMTESIFKSFSKPKVVGVIPARYGSTRLPAKPLVDICGLPMVIHTMKRAMMCKDLDEVIVATDDERISCIVEQYGGKVMMTNKNHIDANYRMYEVSTKIDGDVFVLVNGDEPLLYYEDITKSLKGLTENENIFASVLVSEYNERNNFSNLKMVLNHNDEVMYISRSDIPSDARVERKSMWKGYYIVSFYKESLRKYALEMPKTILNDRESTNENKILEYGYKLKAVITNTNALSVDTPEDLQIVRKMMEKDELFKLYKDCEID